MAHILVTPPSVEPLLLAEAKAHLRVTHADDDDFISRLITAARRQVEMRTGLRLIQQVWRVTYDRWPDDGELRLPVGPVIGVNNFRVIGADDVSVTIDPAHYTLDEVSVPARLAMRPGRSVPSPGRRFNGIELTVTVGFGAAATSVPQELKQAMLLMVGNWFAHRGEGGEETLSLVALDIMRSFRIRRIT
jgi:uncharacterized phiE125 gp8 family phage protein